MKVVAFLMLCFCLSFNSFAEVGAGHETMIDNEDGTITILAPWALVMNPYDENKVLRRFRISSTSKLDEVCSLFGDFYFDLDKGLLVATDNYKELSAVFDSKIQSDPYLYVSSYISKLTCHKNYNADAKPQLAGFPKTLRHHTDWVSSIAISPDSKFILSGSSDKTMVMYEIATGKVHKYEEQKGSVSSVAWSSNGTFIASTSDNNTITVYNKAEGTAVSQLKGHTDLIESISFSPDNQYIISGSSDNTIKIWDSISGENISTFKEHDHDVTEVSWSSDGKYIASASIDDSVILRKSPSGELQKRFRIVMDHRPDYPSSVSFSPNSKYLIAGMTNGSIYVWDVATRKNLFKLVTYAWDVQSVNWSPDSRYIVSGGRKGSIKIWDVSTAKLVETLNGHSDYIRSVAWSPDGKFIVSSSADHTIKIWPLNYK